MSAVHEISRAVGEMTPMTLGKAPVEAMQSPELKPPLGRHITVRPPRRPWRPGAPRQQASEAEPGCPSVVAQIYFLSG